MSVRPFGLQHAAGTRKHIALTCKRNIFYFMPTISIEETGKIEDNRKNIKTPRGGGDLAAILTNLFPAHTRRQHVHTQTFMHPYCQCLSFT